MLKAFLPAIVLALLVLVSLTLFFTVKERNKLKAANKQLLLQNDSLHIQVLETRTKLKKITDSISPKKVNQKL